MQDRRHSLQATDAPDGIPIHGAPAHASELTTPLANPHAPGARIGARVVQDGIGFGTAHFLKIVGVDQLESSEAVPDVRIDSAEIPQEIARFRSARDSVSAKYEEMQGSDIYPILAAFAADVAITQNVEQLIGTGQPANVAFASVVNERMPKFRKILKEKSSEVEAVFAEILGQLSGAEIKSIATSTGDIILVADTILPSMLSPEILARTKGIVAHSISPHARSILSGEVIPVVIVQGDLAALTKPGAKLLVDAARNNCILVDPNDAQLEAYRSALANSAKSREELTLASPNPRTLDDVEIKLTANLDGVAGIERAKKIGLTSVGLVRTELIHREPELQSKLRDIPAQSTEWLNVIEEYHFQAYSKILAAFPKGKVTIRTFDDSADKAGSTTPDWLANRGIRQSLKEKEAEFRAQARAIVRAASLYENAQVLFPMVNDKAEFTSGKRIFFDEISALLERDDSHALPGISHRPNLKFGAMIETPAAMFMVQSLVTGQTRADFLSIGTNDLVRYVLATDGQDHIVGHDNHMYHPAVLRALDFIVTKAREADPSISISVCGDSAGRPFLTNIFLGLGIDTLSVRPTLASGISNSVRTASAEAAERAFHVMLRQESHSAVYDEMQKLLPHHP